MLPFHWINGPAGRELGTGATAVPKLLPAPDYPVGIIAGDIGVNPVFSSIIEGPNDGKMSVASTRLQGAAEHLVLHTTHTFMIFNPIVIVEIVNFLERGEFVHGLTMEEASDTIGIVTSLLAVSLLARFFTSAQASFLTGAGFAIIEAAATALRPSGR